MASIVSFVSQKGGVGKSTLCTNLAVEYAKKGKTLIVDADAQGTSEEWVGRRVSEDIEVACLRGRIHQPIRDLKDKWDYILIDVAGYNSKELRGALLASDVAVVPFRPSIPDMTTYEAIFDIIEDCTEINEKLKAKALIQGASALPQVKEKIEAKAAFDDVGIKYFDTVTHDRKAYRDAIGSGKGVTELET